MTNIIINTLGALIFLLGLGLGLPGIAYSDKKNIAIPIVSVITIVGFLMFYFTK